MSELDKLLLEDCGQFYANPLGWVMWAFDWDHGELEGFGGPDDWQRDYLIYLGEQVRERRFDGVTPVEPIRVATASGHGIGKAQPVDMLIDTPDGERRWGDLRPGDRVWGERGQAVGIRAVQHYKQIEMYRVRLSDGSSTLVSSGHLWAVRGRQERRAGLSTWRTMETIEMIRAGVLRKNGKALVRQWELPQNEPVQMPVAQQLVDPYIFGVWLGDGTKAGGAITSPDQPIFDHAEKIGYGLGPDGSSCAGAETRTLHGLVSELRKIGVFGCASQDRALPDNYKYASIEQREAVLQGLLDTDGWVEASGTVMFGSISEKLVEDVAWLARSLGMVVRLNGVLENWCLKDGVRVYGKPFFTCSITWDGVTQIFRLERQRAKLWAPQEQYRKRWIDSIELESVSDAMCITVDSPTGLYLTNDFIVTHNSALTAWLILWIMSTRPMAKGVVTANTSDQLKTKTWGELGKWKKRCIVGHWFEYNNSRGSMNLYHSAYSDEWRVDAQTCREENSESFAGLHSATSTPFYIYDEASAVPDTIWEVAEGGLTDGEPMMLVFGNPTRNTGRFKECFTRQRHRWKTFQIDSREARMTNKSLIAQWAKDWGDDSDFFRVRVRGMFPKGGDMQFIPSDYIAKALAASPGRYLGDDPLICGIDLARGGDDNCRIQFRRGLDAASEQTYVISGEKSRDSMKVVSLITMVLTDHKPDITFLDETGLGGPIVNRLSQLGYNVMGVNFGSSADDPKYYANKSAEMWARMRNWLKDGGSIPDDPQLEMELSAREYSHNDKDQLVLESKRVMKAKGLPSPDWADALALTFAFQVPKREVERGRLDKDLGSRKSLTSSNYDPLAEFKMEY